MFNCCGHFLVLHLWFFGFTSHLNIRSAEMKLEEYFSSMGISNLKWTFLSGDGCFHRLTMVMKSKRPESRALETEFNDTKSCRVVIIFHSKTLMYVREFCEAIKFRPDYLFSRLVLITSFCDSFPGRDSS